jgi:oxaloacetate decarboxylase gamma subunit
MLAGMVFVFAFLGLLVVFINAVLAKLAIKFPDAKPQTKSSKAVKALNKSTSTVSPSVVAAISSAVSKYRSQHN